MHILKLANFYLYIRIFGNVYKLHRNMSLPDKREKKKKNKASLIDSLNKIISLNPALCMFIFLHFLKRIQNYYEKKK